LDFKVKGFFTGTYNAIGGKISRISTGEVLYNLSGKWSEVVYIQQPSQPNKTLFWDVEGSKLEPKIVVPENEMNEFESRLYFSDLI
jgi:hypothetical protein